MEAQGYSKLVEALRVCNRIDHVGNCNKCYYGSPDAPPPRQFVNGCKRSMCEDAADAIEDLEGFLAEAERDRDEYEERMRKEQERVIELQAEADALAHDIERYVGINAELTTEIEALQAEVKKASHRNAELHAELEKWVSAAEKAGEPKRGKWIGVSPMVDSVQCSICGGQLFSAELETPYCPYCGATMEVQDDKA